MWVDFSCACLLPAPQPANVFLDSELHAKLGDIGLAVMDTLNTASSPGQCSAHTHTQPEEVVPFSEL
jgi:hypothetical protein